MVPQQDLKRPGSGLRKPAKDPYRAASFREAARGIVHKDRNDRRSGFSVDTAGTIARALERAYAQGFADAQAPPPAEKQQTKPEPQPQPQSKPQPKPWYRINPLRFDR